VRTIASICFSSMVGRWVDQSPNRLKTLLSTIFVNRCAVIGASVLWYFIVEPLNGHPEGANLAPSFVESKTTPMVKGTMFGLILVLGILENLSASGNMLSMERDWVVTAASPDGQSYDLTHLNSSMRRIDLICKLIAPILISIIVSATSTKVGVLVVGVMSTTSCAIEILCAKRVWNRNPKLKSPKVVRSESERANAVPGIHSRTIWSRMFGGFHHYVQDFKYYFSSKVWAPSLALALLHISALSYGATFITFLLNAGFSLDLITVARAAGSIVEISSTVVTPVGVQYLGKAQNHGYYRGESWSSQDSEIALLEQESPDVKGRTETGLERLGLWGISWQLLNLVSFSLKFIRMTNECVQVPVLLALWSLSSGVTAGSLPHLASRILGSITSQPLLAFVLFFFLSLSRLGLWIYDLTTQQLTQTMTSPSQRSSFTGVEYSFVSMFELGQHIAAIVLHQPEQFKWIALMSWTAVAISTLIYAGWVWRMRGHLVHWERLSKSCECMKIRVDR
jgi:iron-regulated transporter 1